MTSLPTSASAQTVPSAEAASVPVTELSADAVARSPARRMGMVEAYSELTKARLSALVVMTTAVGYIMAAGGGFAWFTLGMTVLGTALTAGAAGGLNQLMERRRDQRMVRTRKRPLPSGSIGPVHTLVISLLMACLGVTLLFAFVNVPAGTLALLTIVLYLGVYTPLKPRSSVNTLVGAVVGAIPPMIGVAAATGALTVTAWILAGILFVWQIPHFLALAWLYREDYARGGFVMLPMVDRSGELTAQTVVLTSLLLIPLTLGLTMIGATGAAFAAVAIVLGLGLTGLGAALYRKRDDDSARRAFLGSIIYLPILLIVMVIDRGPAGPTIALEEGINPSDTNRLMTIQPAAREGAGSGVSARLP